MGRNSTSSCQLADQLVFRVQSADAVNDENIRVLHGNMLFPVQSVVGPMMKNDDKHFALMKANLLTLSMPRGTCG